ncbi:MAG TPA: histidine phosphatase family protein [Candidatus Ignatzschineria merdigallinarum]|uniref:Histidine phosphatase family protein n=1 Tax=Candidatus Ignatzschineria merdigallinarum TaxID=2838621 RepID=A0A9D1Q435_9GAMM|nr:histidine phosphatase family protein [Candidatus Ignatzschineria merdigallinarum]
MYYHDGFFNSFPFHFHKTYFLTMQQFIFIRHGESLSNVGSSIDLPNADIPLTHKAQQQARDLANTREAVPNAISHTQ